MYVQFQQTCQINGKKASGEKNSKSQKGTKPDPEKKGAGCLGPF